MANFKGNQVVLMHQPQTVRSFSNAAFRVPEGVDTMYSIAYRLGLIDDVKVKFAKPDKLRLF